MEKIKLVIADDEKNIRNSIGKLIDWESGGIEVCGLAENGKEALRLIKESEAQIALLDINMPELTGLEVLARLREENIKTKVIFLSGYDNFEYAREALVYGASNYLLKPCGSKKILEVVLEEGRKIRKEQEKHKRLKLARRPYNIRNSLLSELIWTGQEEHLLTLEQQSGFHIGDELICIVIHPSKGKLFFMEQQEVINDYMKQHLTEIVGNVAENMIALANVKGTYQKRRIRDILNGLKKALRKEFNIEVSIGVSGVVKRSAGMNEAYKRAVKALDMACFMTNDFVVFYDSIYEDGKTVYPGNEEKMILEALKKNDRSLCDEKVDLFFQTVMENQEEIAPTTKNGTALLLSLYCYAISCGLETEEIFGDSFDIIGSIQKNSSIEEVSQMMKEQCRKIINQSEGVVTENQLVNAAVDIIHRSYYRDITLSMVAEEISISPGYLSTLFKQTKGDYFANYLNRIRIKYACKLMEDVRLKNYEIAYQVGFRDEKYFSKVFKKIMGVSPNIYRKRGIQF